MWSRIKNTGCLHAISAWRSRRRRLKIHQADNIAAETRKLCTKHYYRLACVLNIEKKILSILIANLESWAMKPIAATRETKTLSNNIKFNLSNKSSPP